MWNHPTMLLLSPMITFPLAGSSNLSFCYICFKLENGTFGKEQCPVVTGHTGRGNVGQCLCSSGPGLSIRVICAEEPFICKDFAETNNILKIITDFSASVKKVRTDGMTSSL